MIKRLLAFALALLVASPVNSAIISRPNTYTSGTVIDPAQVNSNETTIYTDYNGNIDSTNIKAAGVAVSNLTTGVQQTWAYRRPVLQYNSATVVNIETGVTGTSGQVGILFPDATYRTDSTAGHIQINLGQDAALTGTAQSGLRTGAVANNTWYACYAVESQVNSTDIVGVCDTTLPTQANFSNLNTFFGAKAWVYLGPIRNGDNSASATGILSFTMRGNLVTFINVAAGNALNGQGIRLATATGTPSNASWAYASGTGAAQVPSIITAGLVGGGLSTSATATAWRLESDSAGAGNHRIITLPMSSTQSQNIQNQPSDLTGGLFIGQAAGTNNAFDIYLNGFIDGVLGLGSNPQL